MAKKPTPNQMGDDGEMIIDFSGDLQSRRITRTKSEQAVKGSTDLGSGFPQDMVWVTKDHRKIPIPHMTDDHILNALNKLRDGAVVNRLRMKLAARILIGGVAQLRSVDLAISHPPPTAEALEAVGDSYIQKAEELKALSNEDFLRQYMPIYKHLVREAYKRKLQWL